MSETNEPKQFTEAETKEYYAGLVASIINGDAEKKKAIDTCATALLTKMRVSFPTLSDKVLGTFSSSTAYLFAQLSVVQVRDVSEFIEHTFNDYLVVAAVLAGAYDPESVDVPPVPEAKQPEAEQTSKVVNNTGGMYL